MSDSTSDFTELTDECAEVLREQLRIPSETVAMMTREGARHHWADFFEQRASACERILPRTTEVARQAVANHAAARALRSGCQSVHPQSPAPDELRPGATA